MKKTNDQRHIVIVVFSVLLGITMISFYLLGGLMAKYYTLSSDNDNARVAGWNVKMSSLSGYTEASITKGSVKGTNADFTFSVKSDSEVACEYSIIISGVPKDVTVFLYEGNSAEGTALRELTQDSEDGSELVFQNVGTMQPGAHEANYYLRFNAKIGAKDSETEPSKITVSTRFIQKDGE